MKKLVDVAEAQAILDGYIESVEASPTSSAARELALRVEASAWLLNRLSLLSHVERDAAITRARHAVEALGEKGV